MSGKDRATILDWRVSITIAVGSTVGVGMLLFGMQPRLLLVGLVVIIVGATTWLLLDLGNAASPLVWHDYGTGEARATRTDRRVQMLQSRLKRCHPRQQLCRLSARGNSGRLCVRELCL